MFLILSSRAFTYFSLPSKKSLFYSIPSLIEASLARAPDSALSYLNSSFCILVEIGFISLINSWTFFNYAFCI